MRYPSAKKLKEMDLKLKDVEGAFALPSDASTLDRLKYDLAKQIVAYARTQRITQVELAGLLKIDPARVSEIVNYKIEKFTVDSLLSYTLLLNPKLEVKVKPAI